MFHEIILCLRQYETACSLFFNKTLAAIKPQSSLVLCSRKAESVIVDYVLKEHGRFEVDNL